MFITVWLDDFETVDEYLEMQGNTVDCNTWVEAMAFLPSWGIVRVQWMGDSVNIFTTRR